MNILVTIAHPNPESFNHALLGQFSRGLTEAGHTVEVNDLYAEGFEARLGPADLAHFEGGPLPDDVQAQQAKLAAAEALVFFHPVWWYGFPAILKGWVERVLTVDFAYKFGAKGPLGLLPHTRAHFFRTTMGDKKRYTASRMLEGLDKNIDTTFSVVCGIDNMEFTTFYGVPESDRLRKEYLAKAYRLGMEF